MGGKVLEGIKRIWFYFWGNILTVFLYDRKYLCGEWFEGRNGRLFAPGWRWVYLDGLDRIFRGSNPKVPWPVAYGTRVIGWENIKFCQDDLRNFQGNGVYYQAMGSAITIGKGTWIAAGVGIIASNHDVEDPDRRQQGKEITIGEKCWIGMNAVILPGVVLGPHTTVGAGAVVTKSFPEGNCVIAGNPARLLRQVNQK